MTIKLWVIGVGLLLYYLYSSKQVASATGGSASPGNSAPGATIPIASPGGSGPGNGAGGPGIIIPIISRPIVTGPAPIITFPQPGLGTPVSAGNGGNQLPIFRPYPVITFGPVN